MKNITIQDLEKNYDLELGKVISEINALDSKNLGATKSRAVPTHRHNGKDFVGKQKAKIVLLQFPDGLKQYATAVVDCLEEKTNAEFIIWLGSCFGACDTPVGLEGIKPKIDLVIQFGHNKIFPSYI